MNSIKNQTVENRKKILLHQQIECVVKAQCNFESDSINSLKEIVDIFSSRLKQSELLEVEQHILAVAIETLDKISGGMKVNEVRSSEQEEEPEANPFSTSFPLLPYPDLMQLLKGNDITEHSRTITNYLQQLHSIDHQCTRQRQKLTNQIDQIRYAQKTHALSSHPFGYFNKPLILKMLNEERDKNKPAEEALNKIVAIVFKFKNEDISIQFFPVVIQLLQLVNRALYGSCEEKSRETYSFKFC